MERERQDKTTPTRCCCHTNLGIKDDDILAERDDHLAEAERRLALVERADAHGDEHIAARDVSK